MAKYIPLGALVAEIESKIKYAQTLGDNAINRSMQQFYDGMKQGCVDILSSIDTLEVKEVDLEKEIQRQYEVHKNPNNSIVKDCVVMTKDGFEYFAKYFFELGLKV